jgi:hypothetical protein
MPEKSSSHKPEVALNAAAGSVAFRSDWSIGDREHRALPLWDWILLPLIGVVTIAILGGCSRLIADRDTAQSKQVVGTCIQQDGTGPRHGVPNSVCIERNSSGQLVEYKFNSCGDRSPFDCAQKPEGVFRIVLIGSSIPMGWDVLESDSLSERLLANLSWATHRRVEVYNSAMEGSGGSPDTLANRMPHTVALRPDLILWVISSWDIDPDKLRAQDKAPQGGMRGSRILGRVFGRFKVANILTEYLFRSQSVYLAAYLRNIREGARAQGTPSGDDDGRMRLFSSDVTAIADQARAAGVPLVATFLPNRAEADLLSMSSIPASIDPGRRSNAVRSILVENGATYVDALPDIERTPNLDGLYDQLGYHLNAEGHAALTEILAKALTGTIPVLATGEQAQSERMQKK